MKLVLRSIMQNDPLHASQNCVSVARDFQMIQKRNKIKTHISSIQISKIYSFQTAYWKKNSAEISYCYNDDISSNIYTWGVGSCEQAKLQNTSTGMGFEIKTSNITVNIQKLYKSLENKEHKCHTSNRWKVGDKI